MTQRSRKDTNIYILSKAKNNPKTFQTYINCRLKTRIGIEDFVKRRLLKITNIDREKVESEEGHKYGSTFVIREQRQISH